MLEQLSEQVYLAPGGVNIGVVFAPDDRVILIDTGLNDSAARKVLRWLGEHDRRVAAIVNTHGHADHFGGNAFVVKRTGAKVWAPAMDEAVLRYPMLQPIFLFAGADPPESMRGSFLLADASPVDVVYEEGPLHVEDIELEAVSLAGHSVNQMGIRCGDVFFCADVVLPEHVLERYRIPYLYSVRDHVRALDRALETPHRIAVPGHGPWTSDLGSLVDLNRQRVELVAERILATCREPQMPESILADVLLAFEADPQDPASYYLLHPTVFAFLTYLEESGCLSHHIEAGRSIWQAV